jgi:excisionase family DNA binding protein
MVAAAYTGRTQRLGLATRTAARSPYLLVEDVAERLRCSTRTVHELTRTSAIPHRRLPGTRRCLFRAAELEAWENGAPLDVVELPRGGRLVTPRAATA